MLEVYHYTKISHWSGILESAHDSQGQNALRTSSALGFFTLQGMLQSGTFALLSPWPQDWVDNPAFPLAWTHLQNKLGHILLSVQIDEQKDNVQVADWAHMEYAIGGHDSSCPVDPKYITTDRQQGELRYLHSQVPLNEYLSGDKGKYALPEVILKQDIPMNRIRVTSHQPLLDKLFGDPTITDQYKKRIFKHLISIPETRQYCSRASKKYPILRA